MSHGDPYVYPGTNVLKNLFNERDKSKLDTREQILTSIALDDLRGASERNTQRIFEKIYPFAGRNRTINLSKMEPVLSVKYGKPEFLDEMLGEYTKPLETFKWDDNNKAASAKVFGQRSGRLMPFVRAIPGRRPSSCTSTPASAVSTSIVPLLPAIPLKCGISSPRQLSAI